MVGAIVAQWQKRYAKSTVYSRLTHLRRILESLQTLGAPAIRVPAVPRPQARAIIATHDERVAVTADRLISMRDGAFVDETRLAGGTRGNLADIAGLGG